MFTIPFKERSLQANKQNYAPHFHLAFHRVKTFNPPLEGGKILICEYQMLEISSQTEIFISFFKKINQLREEKNVSIKKHFQLYFQRTVFFDVKISDVAEETL